MESLLSRDRSLSRSPDAPDSRFQAHRIDGSSGPFLRAKRCASVEASPQPLGFSFVGCNPIDFIDPPLAARSRSGDEPSVRPTQAGPGPVLGFLDQASSKGIPLNVADDRSEIIVFLDRERFESALPHVTAGMVVPVVATNMRGHQPLHPGAEVTIADRPDNQVKMVGHQTVTNDAYWSTLAGQFDQLDEGGVVGWLVENLSAGVTAIEDVVAVIGLGSSCSAWHGLENRGLGSTSQGKPRMSPFLSDT